jgi:hypothetical protein
MTNEEVISRLEAAGACILALPRDKARGHVTSAVWRQIAPTADAYDFTDRRLRVSVTSEQIGAMDEAFRWLALIPDDKYLLRRIVAARALVNPLTGRNLFPWRRLATLIGTDHKAIQRWHAQGIDLIVRALAARRVVSPVEPWVIQSRGGQIEMAP